MSELRLLALLGLGGAAGPHHTPPTRCGADWPTPPSPTPRSPPTSGHCVKVPTSTSRYLGILGLNLALWPGSIYHFYTSL